MRSEVGTGHLWGQRQDSDGDRDRDRQGVACHLCDLHAVQPQVVVPHGAGHHPGDRVTVRTSVWRTQKDISMTSLGKPPKGGGDLPRDTPSTLMGSGRGMGTGRAGDVPHLCRRLQVM